MLELLIGNQKYSSWSMRPWMALTAKQVPFTQTLYQLNKDDFKSHFAKNLPAAKVPVLKDGDLVIWDSLAIVEYLAEKFPEKGFWPQDTAQRALARAISSEMHSGFSGLRSECPMNFSRKPQALSISEEARSDVARIEDIWRRALDKSGGPFLFGEFCNADAMFAPVVNRFDIYELSQDETAARYSATMQAHPAWQKWQAAGIAEPWTIERYQV